MVATHAEVHEHAVDRCDVEIAQHPGEGFVARMSKLNARGNALQAKTNALQHRRVPVETDQDSLRAEVRGHHRCMTTRTDRRIHDNRPLLEGQSFDDLF